MDIVLAGVEGEGDNDGDHLVPHYMMRPWQHPHMELVAMEVIQGCPNLHKKTSKTPSLDLRGSHQLLLKNSNQAPHRDFKDPEAF